MPSRPDPTFPPPAYADRAARRTAVSEDQLAEIREEMRREANLVATMIEQYGHPFEGLDSWSSSVDETPDAA